MNQIFAIEYNGDCWQSVFPSCWAEYSQLHSSVEDAAEYIAEIAKQLGDKVNVPQELL